MKRVLRRYRRQKCPKTQGSLDVVVFKPRQVQKYRIVPQRADLEDVAVEIQQAILQQMPDLPTLQALISASPTYLRAYRSQRHSILSNILLRDIHPDVLFDVLAIVDALKLPRNYDDYVPQLKVFIEQYKTARASLHMALKSLEPSTKETMWEFHQSVMDVTEDFCDYALSQHPVTGQGLNHRTSLSPNEVRRIHRAFYRYELFTVLFRTSLGYREEQYKRRRDRDPDRARLALQRDSIRSLDNQDRSFLFLAIFKAWKAEEIACVRDYIIHRYNELYKECEAELQEMIGGEPAYGAAPWEEPPKLMFEVYGDEVYEHYLSCGLGFFHTVIKASHEDRLRLLLDCSGISISSLSGALEDDDPIWDNPMYDAWMNEAFLEFYSDSDRDGPNAAWPWSTGNKVEIHYYQSNKEDLRKWGYVMWDSERLEQWKILQENSDDYLTAREIAPV